MKYILYYLFCCSDVILLLLSWVFLSYMNNLWRKYLQEDRIFLAAYYRASHGILWAMGLILATNVTLIWMFYVKRNIDWIKENIHRLNDPNDNGLVVGLRIGVLIQLTIHGLSSPETMKFLIEKLVGL